MSDDKEVNLLELAVKVGKLEVGLEKAEEDIQNNFTQHKELFDMKKKSDLYATLPNKVEALEKGLDELTGRINGITKSVYAVAGALSFIITAAISILEIMR